MKFHPLVIPALIAASSTIVLSAHAQEIDLSEIVVTPNRTPTEKSKVGSTVNTVSQEQIEQQSLPLVVDYLNQIPGISIAPQGGAGKLTTFTMRGAPGEYVKTLVNGIDISDVTYTKVQTHYGQFLAGNISRIEVLKGSQSTLYGSDAIAGVVDISTQGGVEKGVRHSVFGEAGTYGTFLGGYSLDGGSDRGQFSLSVSGFRTEGFSAAALGTEDDGYENLTGIVAGRYDINDNLSIFGSGLVISGDTEFDDSYPPPDFLLGDSDAHSTYRQVAGRIGADFALFDGRLSNTVSAQFSDLSRENFDSFGGTFDGRRTKFDYLGSFEVNPRLTMNFGADWERQKADTSTGIDQSVAIGGGWIEAVANPVDPLTLTFGLRHDEHSTYGGHTTWRATGSYAFTSSGTRIHSSIGSGYRAPSLYELYAPGSGNPDLRPETSLSFDLGIEQRLLGDRAVADITFFMLDINDYIGFEQTFPYRNIQTDGTVRTRGIEASLTYAMTDWLDLRGAYTYTEATQPDNTRQVRIPRHEIDLSVIAQPWEHWVLSATGKVALDTVDFEGLGKEPLDDYFLLNAKIAYKPTESSELYLRAENLLNQDYEVVRGFNTPGFSVFAGFRAKFGG